MDTFAEIAIGDTKNGGGIHILPSIVDLGDCGFSGLKERLSLATPFNAFKPCPHY